MGCQKGRGKGNRELLINGYKISVLKGESSYGDARWRQLHSRVMHNITELHKKTVKMVNFMSCVFYHHEKLKTM